MDEPFGALDAQTRETLQGELLDIHSRTGKTILFVTHDSDEAVIIADRVVVMKDGRVQEIMNVPLKRPRPDLGLVRGMSEFAETRIQSLACAARRRHGALMVDIANRQEKATAKAEVAERRPLPRWMITVAVGHHSPDRLGNIWPAHQSGVRLLSVRDCRGVLGACHHRPALVGLIRIPAAIRDRLCAGHCGRRPLGLFIGGFRAAEAALGFYITAGYAMPLVALVPLLILWLGLGFAVKVAVIFLMALFPICINTWLGVTAVPKTLIEVGKSFVAPDTVILRRIILPATLPYIMAGIRLAVGRAVVGMVIAEFFTTISGLGAVIINSANNFDTATMFVPIIILMVMAIGLNWLIGFVERWVAPWQAEISGRDRE
jgi:ABC-type nitrate/sulfonate/bicarbonate transport system permease component